MKIPHCAATVIVGKLTSSNDPEQENMMVEHKLSFDPDSITSEQTLSVTLRDIAIEAGTNLQIHERVNKIRNIVTPEGKVVDPERDIDTDVLEYYSVATERDEKETAAARNLRNATLNHPDGTIGVWYSPRYNDQGLGRITVSHIDTIDGVRESKGFGIVSELTPDEMLISAWRLQEFTDVNYKLDRPEDLRSIAMLITLPEMEENPWEFLRNYIPMDEVWNSILGNSVDENLTRTNIAAEIVARRTFNRFINARSMEEKIQAVQYSEQLMANNGHNIDHSQLDCPSRITTSQNSINYQFSFTALNSAGEIIFTHNEKGWEFTPGTCRDCKKETDVGPCSICKTCEKKYD